LLLMAAQKDALMGDAVEETRRLFLRAGEPKQLVVLDGCDHYETYFAGFDRVLKHTMEFLESHSLAPPTPTTSTLPPAVASPVHGDTACHLDPWTFAGRWAILQETIQASHLPWSSQAPLGDEGAHDGNLMWGIALQMEWQFKSGRHSQFEDRATGAVVICPTAFWAAVNYFLSAALFLAAQQAGLPRLQGQRLYVDRVEELTSPDRARLFQRQAAAPYYNDAQRKATELWVAYFRDIAVAQALPLETFRGREEELRKELAGAMWRAHTASLHFATEACAPELHNLPVAEREFVIGFASTVDDIETEYLTTTSRPGITEMQYALFPPRLLTASDPMNGPVPGFSETQSQFSQGMRRRGKKRLASKL